MACVDSSFRTFVNIVHLMIVWTSSSIQYVLNHIHFDLILENSSNFYPFVVVDRGTETECQVGDFF